MDWINILLIVFAVVVAAAVGLYFLNRWAAQKTGQQQALVDRNKMEASIFVIDKKRDYIKNVNMPKAVIDSIPKWYSFMKMYFVQAKVGPKITTLMCEKKIFNQIQTKKTIKVDLAGIYIIAVKGAKTEAQIKEQKKNKKDTKGKSDSAVDKAKNIFKSKN